MSEVADEFAAADMHWFFPEPTHHRSLFNTDELFNEYVSNPQEFENYQLSTEYFAIRYTDLKKDMEKIKLSGDTKENQRKYYYYLGMTDAYKQAIMNATITRKKKQE
jgi:hypothetical protein